MNEDDSEQTTVNSASDQKEKNKQAKDKANNNKATKAVKGAAKYFIRAHIVPICIGIFAIFQILIIIGILQVLLSMPGMILGKLKEFGQNLLSSIVGALTGDNISFTIDKEDEIEVAQYIQDMGYDVVGYGFADAQYEKKEDSTGDTGIENPTITDIKGINGRNYIQQYLVQNEATYTVAAWSIKGWLTTWGRMDGRSRRNC